MLFTRSSLDKQSVCFCNLHLERVVQIKSLGIFVDNKIDFVGLVDTLSKIGAIKKRLFLLHSVAKIYFFSFFIRVHCIRFVFGGH